MEPSRSHRCSSPPRLSSARCASCSRPRTSAVRSGRPSSPLRARSPAPPRRCAGGCAKRSVSTAFAKGRRRPRSKRVRVFEREVRELRHADETLKLASAFFAQAAASTTASSRDRVRRAAPRALRGRTDRQGFAGRPGGGMKAAGRTAGSGASVRARATRRHARGRDRTRLTRQPAGPRRGQGLEAASARGHRGGALHRRAAGARPRLAQCRARQGRAHERAGYEVAVHAGPGRP